MLNVHDRQQLFERIENVTQSHDTIFVIDYAQGTRDWQGIIPFGLNNGGVQTNQTQFEDLIINEYKFDSPYSQLIRLDLNIPVAIAGKLRLESAQLEEHGNNTGELAIALEWTHQSSIPQRLNGTLRLKDEDGREIMQQTVQLIDQFGRPSELWSFNEPFLTYHTVPIPEGTAPLMVTVSLDLFYKNDDGSLHYLEFVGDVPTQELTVGQTHLIATSLKAQSQIQPIEHLTEPLSLNDALSLLAFSIDRREVFAGQTAFVHLLWQAETAPMPEFQPQLLLMQDGALLTAVSTSTTLSRYPTSQWQAGERVFETRPLQIPAELSGETTIVLQLGDSNISLGTLNILESDRHFTAPAVQFPLTHVFGETAVLVGIDLPQSQFQANETIPLTLHWQSLTNNETTPYKIFIHLLDENDTIVGQIDVEPVGGRRPFTSWVKDEYISDPLSLTLKDPTYQGPLKIALGIYNPADGTRLQNSEGNGRVILPTMLTIQN